MTARVILPILGSLILLATACKKGDEGDAKDGKDAKADGADAKADGGDEGGDEGEAPLTVADGSEGVDGPVPPDTSMVFFQVEGALIPLACFNKDKGKLQSGTDCLGLVPAGAQARVGAGDQAFNKVLGERTEPSCMAGSGKEVALAAENLTGGAEFTFGTWPPSGLKTVKLISDDATSPAATTLDDDTKGKLQAKVGKGEITAHQVAEIDVDGDGKKDGIYSVFVPHPKLQEMYTWSGVFLAKENNLDNLVELANSRSRKDVFEVMGVLNLDGQGASELWVRMIYEDGAGDAIFQLEGDKATRLGKWSCGA